MTYNLLELLVVTSKYITLCQNNFRRKKQSITCLYFIEIMEMLITIILDLIFEIITNFFYDQYVLQQVILFCIPIIQNRKVIFFIIRLIYYSIKAIIQKDKIILVIRYFIIDLRVNHSYDICEEVIERLIDKLKLPFILQVIIRLAFILLKAIIHMNNEIIAAKASLIDDESYNCLIIINKTYEVIKINIKCRVKYCDKRKVNNKPPPYLNLLLIKKLLIKPNKLLTIN